MSDGGAARLRWRHDVSLRVVWSDRTRFGGPLGTRLEHHLRMVTAEAVDALGEGAPLSAVHAALDRAADTDEFAQLIERASTGWRLRPEVLWPDPDLTTPSAVALAGADGIAAEVTLPRGHWAPAHALFAELADGGAAPRADGRHPDMQTLLDGLLAGGFVELVDDGAALEDASGALPPGATFVGHSTVVVASAQGRVAIDPFLLPWGAGHPAGYQPYTPAELGRLDAILLTHAHPDHFDPGTLLRLAPDIPVIVPAVERESTLAPDLARRLHELGCTDVRARRPGATECFADLEVHVLTFTGEQPSDALRLHEEARNEGNAYVVRTPALTVACIADAGRDSTGAIGDTAAAWRRGHGPVDVLFSGYRGWYTYPAQLLLSSVARFFLFLERSTWSSRLHLMNDADDAVDTAERFGARTLVPYSAGGAPWYWDRGLGPRADTGWERPGFDPLPERVVEAAAARAVVVGGGAMASPVEVVVLRPGDTLEPGGRLVRVPGHAWPYEER